MNNYLKLLFLVAPIILFLFSCRSIVEPQEVYQDSTTIYPNLDTMEVYMVDLEMRKSNLRTRYWVDGKRARKAKYDKYYFGKDDIGDCAPCYMKAYGVKDRLLYEGVFYTDCAAGIWMEYYRNGKIKSIGHYKENDTGDWDNVSARGYCYVKDGLWTFYNKKGKVIKTERYKDGNLVQ